MGLDFYIPEKYGQFCGVMSENILIFGNGYCNVYGCDDIVTELP
jgi:hypothetical protein